jgi:hypothetical protein
LLLKDKKTGLKILATKVSINICKWSINEQCRDFNISLLFMLTVSYPTNKMQDKNKKKWGPIHEKGYTQANAETPSLKSNFFIGNFDFCSSKTQGLAKA